MKKTYAFLILVLAFGLFAKQAHASLPDTFGPQRTLVVIGNLTDATGTSTVTQLSDIVLNNVNNYYQNISGGKMSLTGDVVGPYTIQVSSSTCSRSVVANATVAAVDADVNFSNYDRMLIIIPLNSMGCGWGGISTMGKVSVATGEGTLPLSYSIVTNAYNSSYVNDRTIAHEYGHQLGLAHADYLDCGTIPLATSTSVCTDVDIADHGDNMGDIANLLMPLNGPHLDMLGWIDPSNKVEASTGDYTLVPAESSAPGIKFLKIPRAVTSNGSTSVTTYTWVEYNQPIGFATMFAYLTGYTSGATIHIDQPLDTHSYLIGASSGSTYYSPDLLPGATFTDPLTASKIKVISTSTNALVLHIDQGKTDFTLPTASITYPMTTDVASGTVSLAADASDVDSGIQKVEFYVGNNLVGTSYAAPYSVPLDTTVLPNGTNYIRAVAYDNSGQAFGVVNNSYSTPTQQFTVNNPDTIPPTSAITTPLNNSYTQNLATITAVASDDVGVASISIYKDISNISIGSCSSVTTCTKSVVLSNGVHTLYAIAKDFAGNTTKSEVITVTAVAKPTVSITSPTNNSVVQGIVAINANASSSAGISKVEFYADSALIGNSTVAPYTMSWNTAGLVASSTHTLLAKAYDTIGLVSSSTAVTVSIADTTKPVTSVTSPANNAQVTHSTNVTISASASDNLAVTKVEFYVSNVLKCTDLSAPYSCVWTVPTAKGVAYQLQTKAYDAANNVGSSTIVNVTSK